MLLRGFCGALVAVLRAGAAAALARATSLWWAVFSALAVLTHFFAGFLVAPGGVLAAVARRDRARAAGRGAVRGRRRSSRCCRWRSATPTHPLGWIKAFPLSVRIQQVPVAFGLSTLYQSSLVTYGLWGRRCWRRSWSSLLVVGGATSEQLRGAGGGRGARARS